MKITINSCQFGFDLMGYMETHNQQAVPPIVLIHGLGLDRTIWHPLVSGHLSDFEVIMPDMLGHGESDAPQGPYPMSLMAENLAELLETLDISKAIVCGHSMGGYVALAFASQFPQMLAGLGLITTNAYADSEEKRTGRYDLIKKIKEQGAIALAESLAPKLSRDPVVIKKSHQLISKTKPMGLIGALEGMALRPDRTAFLPEVDVPAIVAAGEDDQITNYDEAQLMAEALPQGQFLGLPNVGHMPMLEDPAALGEGLQALFQRVIESSSG